MKNLVTRACTGAFYVAAIVLAVIHGGWWLSILACVLGFFALYEFLTLTNNAEGGERKVTLWADLLALIAAITLVGTHIWSRLAEVCAIFLVLYLLGRPVLQLYTREKKPIVNLALSYMGLVYITVPLMMMIMIRSLFPGGEYLLLAMFLMIWLSDTGAYCVGSLIGRHKLFPRISPAKSIEGFVGGVIFSIGVAFLLKYCFGPYYTDISLAQLVTMGSIVAVFSTWGDLVESLIKRSLGVKDSGNILPGHGGMFDRIDSLLLAAPATFFYFLFIF
ncbi:MAG: phosphatidate cytidylyltransferase [Duncaniella sp.]|nr:phosphatidate cytidylyltransferase [Duncaniella sp.]